MDNRQTFCSFSYLYYNSILMITTYWFMNIILDYFLKTICCKIIVSKLVSLAKHFTVSATSQSQSSLYMLARGARCPEVMKPLKPVSKNPNYRAEKANQKLSFYTANTRFEQNSLMRSIYCSSIVTPLLSVDKPRIRRIGAYLFEKKLT